MLKSHIILLGAVAAWQWHELVLFKAGTDLICTALFIVNIISTFREKGRDISKA